MNPELLTSVACFYTLVHKFPTDVGAFQLRSTLRNILPQLATSKFVAWQVESEGGNTGNNAFQLATQQCCARSCAKMLPVLLDLKQWPPPALTQ